jgi:uncharacterized membrane protein YqaE (UPF0057 family)
MRKQVPLRYAIPIIVVATVLPFMVVTLYRGFTLADYAAIIHQLLR